MIWLGLPIWLIVFWQGGWEPDAFITANIVVSIWFLLCSLFYSVLS